MSIPAGFLWTQFPVWWSPASSGSAAAGNCKIVFLFKKNFCAFSSTLSPPVSDFALKISHNRACNPRSKKKEREVIPVLFYGSGVKWILRPACCIVVSLGCGAYALVVNPCVCAVNPSVMFLCVCLYGFVCVCAVCVVLAFVCCWATAVCVSEFAAAVCVVLVCFFRSLSMLCRLSFIGTSLG